MTGGSDTDIANADFNSMSCDDIQAMFAEYREQMDNVDTGASLLSAVGVDSGTSEAKAVMAQAYSQAATTARPVLKVKQCSFTV